MTQEQGTRNKEQGAAGFTLVELLVASAIFSVVSIVAVGAILTINDANRKTQAIRAVVDNMNFTMESMSRKLRTGSKYHCDATGLSSGSTSLVEAPCLSDVLGATSMAYLSSDEIDPSLSSGNIQGQTVIYKFCRKTETSSDCGTAGPGTRGKIITFKKQADGITYTPVTMTPPEIDIQDLRFYVRSLNNKPVVTIALNGEIKLAKENLTTPFNLQTTVASRLR